MTEGVSVLRAHLQQSAAKNTKDYVKEKKHICQNPDISDRKARSLGPSGPMSGTSCLLPTLMAFPWVELPHVATETHSSNAASSASNYIWLHWNQEDIRGQGIFICTKCLSGQLQEMTPVKPTCTMSPTSAWHALVSHCDTGNSLSLNPEQISPGPTSLTTFPG